jgi:putative ABC transport system permease protein
MLFWTIVKVALKSLLANKLRTVLAMLGIIIGVAAVISMLAVGTWAQGQVMNQISAMGTNLLLVRPGQRSTGGVFSGTAQNLTVADAEALVRNVPGIKYVTPVVSNMAQLKYLNSNTRTFVTGAAVPYFPSRNYKIGKGRIFTEDEAEKNGRVAVLGPVTAEKLFGEESGIGEIIKINGINFRVVGVLEPKGDQGFFNFDDQAIVPYTTAMTQLFGQKSLREIDVQTEDGVDVAQVQTAARKLLRKRHRILPEMPDDVEIRSQAEALETVGTAGAVFTVLLGSIAGISLLVGGIGIMNIMLVTVTERTREIGVRKAIGAQDRDILGQFLIESVLLSGIGGLLGIAMGMVMLKLVSIVATRTTEMGNFDISVEWMSVLVSFGFAVSVGIFFGYYPARRAAAMDPIEALRYE